MEMILETKNVFGTRVHSDHNSDWKSFQTRQDLKRIIIITITFLILMQSKHFLVLYLTGENELNDIIHYALCSQ